METVVIRIKLRDGKNLEDVRHWFRSLNNRLPEVIESMESEGVLVESAILDKRSDGDYVIYYLKAISVRQAYDIFDRSVLAIDEYYKENWRSLFQGREELEVIFDVDRIRADTTQPLI